MAIGCLFLNRNGIVKHLAQKIIHNSLVARITTGFLRVFLSPFTGTLPQNGLNRV